MRRLKYKEIKEIREALLKAQDDKCALSGIPLSPDRAVLDHAHDSGKIRATLDRGVNAFLGKIENSMVMNRISQDMLAIICERLIEYITTSEKDLLHPTHRTPEEKKALQAKRRKNARKRK